TTDACFVMFALVTLASLTHYVRQPTWSGLVLLAATFSLAFAAKYTATVLLGVLALTLLLDDRVDRPWRRRVLTAAGTTAVIAVVALCAAWAAHGFELTPSEMLGVKKDRVPASIAGLLAQMSHQSRGHSAFLFGARNDWG